ncbi:MAG: FIST N-terminal domain-containing protein [Phycisphaerae bacterium]|nr:FIST N-terminal domain-containing protein [Phycisphaerae bacterium]
MVLVGVAAMLLAGCGAFHFGSRLKKGPLAPPGSARWSVATGFARGQTSAAATSQAAENARRQLGGVPAKAVVFFECFGGEENPRAMAAIVQSAFPQADVVGCSAAGVATREGAASDRGVAVLAIGGTGCRFGSAFAPGTFASADAAGKFLAKQLPAPDAETALLVLAAPATVQRDNWDANRLLAAVAGRGGSTIVFGGLASQRGRYARLYHAGRAFPDGVVVLQITGLLDWEDRSAHEMLRVGPIWRPKQIRDRSFGSMVAGKEELAAEAAANRCLIAQDRLDPHIGRLAGDTELPIAFEVEAGQMLKLASWPREDDRFVFLRPASAAARMDVMTRVVDTSPLPAGVTDGPAATVFCLPAGPHDGFADEVAAWGAELARLPHSHPAPIAFLGPGQFVPITIDDARSCQFASHTFTAVQFAKRAVTGKAGKQ